MRQTWLLVAASLTLSPCLAAQDPVGATHEKKEANAEAKAEYASLTEEFTAAQEVFYNKMRKASRSERRRLQKKEDPAIAFIPRFQEAAGKFAESAGAIPFLTWLIDKKREADNDVSKDALANLVVDHVTSPDLTEAVLKLERSWYFVGKADTQEAFGEILANNKHDKVVAAVLYVQSMMTVRERGVSEGDKKSALASLRKAIKMSPDGEWVSGAEGVLFEDERLQLGMQVPDIEGKDLDGVAFKLSDYKGKVILVDFWGDW